MWIVHKIIVLGVIFIPSKEIPRGHRLENPRSPRSPCFISVRQQMTPPVCASDDPPNTFTCSTTPILPPLTINIQETSGLISAYDVSGAPGIQTANSVVYNQEIKKAIETTYDCTYNMGLSSKVEYLKTEHFGP